MASSKHTQKIKAQQLRNINLKKIESNISQINEDVSKRKKKSHQVIFINSKMLVLVDLSSN